MTDLEFIAMINGVEPMIITTTILTTEVKTMSQDEQDMWDILNKSDTPTKPVVPTVQIQEIKGNNLTLSAFELLELESQRPQIPTIIERISEVSKPNIVYNSGPDAFDQLLTDFNTPVSKPEVKQVEVKEVVKTVPSWNNSAMDELESTQAKIEAQILAEQKKKQAIQNERDNRELEVIRKSLLISYELYNESTGQYDELAYNVSTRMINDFNKLPKETKQFLIAEYNIHSILGFVDTNKLIQRFGTPISRIKFYQSVVDNGLPTK